MWVHYTLIVFEIMLQLVLCHQYLHLQLFFSKNSYFSANHREIVFASESYVHYSLRSVSSIKGGFHGAHGFHQIDFLPNFMNVFYIKCFISPLMIELKSSWNRMSWYMVHEYMWDKMNVLLQILDEVWNDTKVYKIS